MRKYINNHITSQEIPQNIGKFLRDGPAFRVWALCKLRAENSPHMMYVRVGKRKSQLFLDTGETVFSASDISAVTGISRAEVRRAFDRCVNDYGVIETRLASICKIVRANSVTNYGIPNDCVWPVFENLGQYQKEITALQTNKWRLTQSLYDQTYVLRKVPGTLIRTLYRSLNCFFNIVSLLVPYMAVGQRGVRR